MDIDRSTIMTLFGLGIVTFVTDTVLKKAGKENIAMLIDLVATIAGIALVFQKVKPVLNAVWRDFL